MEVGNSSYCRAGNEANDRAVWSRNLGKCMYVCLLVKCLVIGLRV